MTRVLARLTADDGPVRSLLRRASRVLAPLLASWLPFWFLQVLHRWILRGDGETRAWALLPLVPILAWEWQATRLFEARRHGWRWHVIAGVTARGLFFCAMSYMFLWLPMMVRREGTLNPVIVLIGYWPSVAALAWIASPLAAVPAGICLASAYAALTVRLRMFRLTTTVLLPTLASFLLFRLFYFHPTSALRGLSRRRPVFVERIFPHKRYRGLNGALRHRADGAWRHQSVFFPRDLYVPPDDAWIMASFGPTWPLLPGDRLQPNLIWADLHSTEYKVFLSPEIRRFAAGCDKRLYFSPFDCPMDYPLLLEYHPGADTLRELLLPRKVAGQDVGETMQTYRSCEDQRVYILNGSNPVLFVWDTARQRLEKTLPLTDFPGVRMSASVSSMMRNPVNGTLLIGIADKCTLLEIEEKSLRFRRCVNQFPHMPFFMSLSQDSRHIYLSCFLYPEILKLDSSTLQVVGRLPAPGLVRQIRFSQDGRWLFAAGYVTGEVAVYDAATDREVLRFYVTPKLEALHATARYLYVGGAEGLFRVRLDSFGEMLARERAG